MNPFPPEPVDRDPRWTRPAFTGRILRLLMFPLMTLVVGHLVLFNIEQAQEALRSILDEGWPSLRLGWYAGSHFIWSLSVWYTARLLLSKRWAPAGAAWTDPIGRCVSAHWAHGWVTWLPRAMAFSSTVPSVWVMVRSKEYAAAGVLMLGTMTLLIGLVFRRRVLMRFMPGPDGPMQAYNARRQEQWDRFDSISPGGWLLLVGMGILPWLIVLSGLVGGQRDLTWVARHIGTPGLVLLALASYNVVGSMALVYAPMTRGWGSWALLPALFWLGFSAFNENHQVAKRLDIPVPQVAPVAPEADLAAWLAQRRSQGREHAPIYLVALSGGASRAAYWGAYTLAWLDDLQRAQGRAFLADVYAISGVSGGSLGASTLVAAMASSRELALHADFPAGTQSPPLADWMSDVLTLDHLSPLVQSLLYVDLMARLSPWPLPALDRSYALERTWEQDVEQAMAQRRGGVRVALTNWFALPMESLYESDTTRCATPGHREGPSCVARLPRLILNATSAVTGEPVLQTTLNLQHPLSVHMRDPSLDLRHLTLSEAIHNSARFPYLSPAGQVRSADDAHGVDYWVDGGYFENSGTWALQVLLQRWAQAAPWRQDPQAWRELLSRIRVIVFSNEPVKADGASWLPPDGVSNVGLPHAYEPQSSWMIEFTAPALGLYATRTARAQSETYRLAQMLTLWRTEAGLSVEPVVYQLRMPLTAAKTPSMNWFINRRSSCVLRSYVQGQDLCPQVGAPAMPSDWSTASGYLRYRAELTRLMAELRAQPVAPGLPPPPAPASQPTP
ncbi:MAG: hypothetical protein ACM3VZ_00080 [Acidobacteriota bacterium]